ncbi:MAG: gamma-glutamyl-gamma-aminobutyrate hydrolase family protein [Actinobacteria bacterium]|nr:gamma-glutamyl-gamma-aminobutyrate hydrolase family protein [Actinomycetota bacterium]
MARPVIGVSTYVEPARWGAWEVPAALLHEWYVDAVREAGGRAVLLPPDIDDADVLDRVDGLILIGGADIGPATYGAEPHPTTDQPRLQRDVSEILLCRGARDRDLPLLGICRGLQVMAVAHGGTLIQDLPDAGYGLAHREQPGTFTQHDVAFADGSRIAAIYGTTTLGTNSSHHQGIADPGSLVPTGWSHDGLVEVCEAPDARFAIGVQWHPEHPDRRATELPLFRALMDAAATNPQKESLCS